MERKKRETLRKSLVRLQDEMKQQVVAISYAQDVLLFKRCLNLFAGGVLSGE